MEHGEIRIDGAESKTVRNIFSRYIAGENLMGIAGTIAKKRPGFMKMIEDCRKGKIDMILTKSFSRFSRNNLDSLLYVRELQDLGIPIIFDKEGINTLQVSSELLTHSFRASMRRCMPSKTNLPRKKSKVKLETAADSLEEMNTVMEGLKNCPAEYNDIAVRQLIE